MILQALNGYYERVSQRPDRKIAPPGYSYQPISFAVLLSSEGEVVDINDLRTLDGNRPRPTPLLVPQPPKRAGTKPPPCFLWDKTAYVFGVERSDDAIAVENPQYRDAFRAKHLKAMSGASDPAVQAFLHFLNSWDPARYSTLRYSSDMLDTNVVFRIDGEQLYLHDLPEAQAVWEKERLVSQAETSQCLVTGLELPIARLHPRIGGITVGGQRADTLVGFNEPSFESYGKKQGDNAPVSERAAFAYTTALNELLRSDNRVKVGDAATVFWAEAADSRQAEVAEKVVGWLLEPPSLEQQDAAETALLRAEVMDRVAKGRPLESQECKLRPDTKFYILGLSPNAARLSVRFWEATTLGAIGEAFHQHWQDLRMQPERGLPPSVYSCALMTSPARPNKSGEPKLSFDDISPLLSGELMRAILTGGRYPAALLTNLVMRIRSDHYINRLRVSLIKAAIVRALRIDGKLPTEDYLVRSDPNDPNPARRLGRLFAVLERAQLAALGDGINATIKDKYIGSAAATPALVFPFLVKNSNHHAARLRRGHADAGWIKDAQHAKRVGMGLERDIGRLWAAFNDGLPPQLSTTEQGLFFVGYYQERFGGKPDPDSGEPATDQADTEE
jgi:CRISPR-associated protein Csd1